jgi:hypothetical protein
MLDPVTIKDPEIIVDPEAVSVCLTKKLSAEDAVSALEELNDLLAYDAVTYKVFMLAL